MEAQANHDPKPVEAPRAAPVLRRRGRPFLKYVVIGVVGAAIVSGFFLSGLRMKDLKAALKTLQTETDIKPDPVPRKISYDKPWNGLVEVDAEQEEAIGFGFAPVKAQADPLLLELNGRTAYDPNTLTKIRPRFDVRVEKVFTEVGKPIHKNDPLVELYSTDLAAAKSDYQVKYVQWQHDLKLKNLRQDLVKSGAISQQAWVDTQNDERKSRLDFNLALDKLVVMYEVPQSEIDPLVSNLGDQTPDARNFGDLTDKAKFTIRSKTDGIVIEREVVEKNFYETTEVLMVIAPMDHLWVLLNVYELDQDRVKVGQTLQIQFPFISEEIKGKVDYVANEVSKDTRAVKVRAAIPNPNGKLKADMWVKAKLSILPEKGQTVIPRLALVALDGADYAFVRVPDGSNSKSESSHKKDRFERRKLHIVEEDSDHVVISKGLAPGEEVVTNGSLILSQLYEDQQVIVLGSAPH